MTNSHQKDRTDPADDLVKLARTERDAFGQLFDHFSPFIFAYCTRRLAVRAIAEDVASEVFLKVAQGIRDFPVQSSKHLRTVRFMTTAVPILFGKKTRYAPTEPFSNAHGYLLPHDLRKE